MAEDTPHVHPPKVPGFLQKKVFGVPLLWVALIVAAGLLYWAIKMKGNSSASDTSSTDSQATDSTGDGTDSTDTSGGDSGDTQQPVFIVPNGTTSTVTTDTGTTVGMTGAPVATTNAVWGQEVTTWLIAPAQGYSVDVASRVVNNYLNGEPLTQSDAAIRDKAVQQFGLPPEGVPYVAEQAGTSPVNKPAVKQGTPPLTHTVKGNHDNTPTQLAVLYYGSNSSGAVATITGQPNNVGMKSPYPVGSKVHIPSNTKAKYFRATTATHTLSAIAAKNGERTERIQAYNPGMKFPVKVGTQVRVG